MQISNNVNSMIQLERNLDESAHSISKVGLNTNNVNGMEKKDAIEISEDINLVNEMVKQVEIPLAYTANAEVISIQDSVARTLLDIKA